MKIKESSIERLLARKVGEMGGRAYKFVSPGNAGVPDRLVVLPQGRVYFVELKAPGKKPSKVQEIQIKRLERLGCDVRVIDSTDGVRAFIEEVMPCEVHTPPLPADVH